MSTHPGTVTVWQSGRLAPRAPQRRFAMRREHWLGAAMLLLAALVMAAYVVVLERDVERNEAPRPAPPVQVEGADGAAAGAPSAG